MDKVGTENKENVNKSSQPPKFMLPSISSLPTPSPLTPFQQTNTHESADAILRGSPAQATFPNQSPLSARTSTQPFEVFTKQEKQEIKPSTAKYYLPNPSATYDPMNTSYTTTYWPAYYDYSYQSNRDINGSIGPPYNVSTWFASDTTFNNRQEGLRSPIPTRPFVPYYNNNNRHLPPLTPNLHTIINSSPSFHHLDNHSTFTNNIQQRKSDTKGEDLEGDNSEIEGIKVQRADIKSPSNDRPFTHDNIDPALLNFPVKREDDDETPLSTPLSTPGTTEGKKKSRSNWSRKETRSLISAVKSKHKILLAAQRNAEKSRIWSDMFSDHCARYSGRTLKAFKLRWARLVADYNSVHECIKTGVEPMDFDFYDEMKEILNNEAVAGDTTSNLNEVVSSDLTEKNSVPVLKRKLDDRDEKAIGTSQIEMPEEDLEDRSLVLQSSPLHSPSSPGFELNDDEASLFQQSKKFKVDEEVKNVLKEVEDTQRKCKKIIEQLKDITK